MLAQRTQYGWVLWIDAGEELFETLRAFAVQHDVRASRPDLGYHPLAPSEG